jgi:hypothetical protein
LDDRFGWPNMYRAFAAVLSDDCAAVEQLKFWLIEAMLGVVGAQSDTRSYKSKRSLVHWLPSHRHDTPAPNHAVFEYISRAVVIHVTAAVGRTDGVEMAHEKPPLSRLASVG